MIDKILDKLNPEQLEAVKTTEGYVRLVAGAGSGKTRALTSRYAYIVEELGIPTYRVLSVTFTNKAANEMKTRIINMVGDVGTPFIMTFHGFCNRVLRDEIDKMGYPLRFKIIDTEDQQSLLKPVYEELGITNKDVPYKKSLNDYIGEGCKHGSRSLIPNYEEILDKYSVAEINNMMDMAPTLDTKIVLGYLREQKKDFCLDYDDLLNFVLYLFKVNHWVKDRWQDSFDYIQVDEFQDVSMREFELVSILSEKSGNLFVVGDPDQCLIEGTKVRTDVGFKCIEDIEIGDTVISGVGNSESLPFKVESTSKKYVEDEIMIIKTESGKEIRGTKNHVGFSRIPNDRDAHYVYLMYRKDIGFRIGTTSGVSQGVQADKNGYEIRLSQEKADELWIIKKLDTLKEALFWENFYSYNYGIPQYVFVPRTQTALTEDDILKLHSLLDTYTNGLKLLKDFGMFKDFPHWIPQASGLTDRHKLNFTMFGSTRKYSWGVYPNELCANTSNENYISILSKYFSVTEKVPKSQNRQPYTNVRKSTWDYDSQFEIINNVMTDCMDADLHLSVKKSARLTDKKYSFTPLSHMFVGMFVPVYVDGVVTEERIVSVEKEVYKGYVYDINIPNVRNYIANDIVVHNCIYSFRGSKVSCITKFDIILSEIRHCPVNVTTLYLNTNYRSTPDILDVSNSLIKHNINRLDKTMITPNNRGTKVLHYHAKSIYQEADWVVRRILSLNRNYSDIAILYRSNATSRALEEKLMSNRVPYEVLSGVSFYQRKEIKDVLAVLSLVAFDDNISFKRVVQNIPLGVGKKKIEFLTDFADKNNCSLYAALRANIGVKQLKATQASFLVSVVEELKNTQHLLSLDAMIGKVIDSFDMTDAYTQSGETERLENILELKKSARHFEHQMGEKVMLADYLGTLSLYSEADKEENPDRVKLMTVHASKGLEYPVIFLVGLSEGLMPSSRTATAEDMEEERRIAYVAMTRAEEMLFLTDAEGLNYDNSQRFPSRFLFNIQRDLYNSEGVMDPYLVKMAQSQIEDSERKLGTATFDLQGFDVKEKEEKLKVGDRVKHPAFGDGTLLQEDLKTYTYIVLFDSGAAKGIRMDSNKLTKA